MVQSPRRRTTLADVAARAGVSTTTASFVLNDREAGIAADTKERIRQAAAELRYRPNAAAKSLSTRRTHSLGFITDEIASTPYAGEIIRGAQEAAWAHGQVLLVVNTDGAPDVEHAAVEMMLERQVEGVVFASMHTREVSLPVGLGSVPTVLVNCFDAQGSSPHPSVLPDDETGGRVATELLLEAGHRRIAMINGDDGTYAWVQRRRGFETALDAFGVRSDPALVLEGNWHPDVAYELTWSLFTGDNPPTALVCANDRTAHGAYDALRDLGLSVPGDVSVIGYDDQEMARYLRPALSTIALPHYELGRRGCDLLMSESGLTNSRELVTCPPRIRDSIAPPPR